MAFKVQIRAYDASANTADSAIVTTNYPPPTPTGPVLKYYDGTTLHTVTPKYYDGSTLTPYTITVAP